MLAGMSRDRDHEAPPAPEPLAVPVPDSHTHLDIVVGVAGLLAAAIALRAEPSIAGSQASATSPIYGVTIPADYRDWRLIAPATEDAPLDELRVVLGNPIAIDAFRRNIRPFPDGAVLVKLAWKRQRSADFASATIPGEATTVQVMVKDRTRFGASGGWGYGRFTAGVPANEAQHRTCFACHDARVRDHDWVFTRYAG